jgi:endoribonuclease Dicer
LESLSTLRASEDFSFERLELLGDSVLKYAVSCSVYFKYPNKHEGQLTSTRTQIICNSTLHRLGVRRNIQVVNTKLVSNAIVTNFDKVVDET